MIKVRASIVAGGVSVSQLMPSQSNVTAPTETLAPSAEFAASKVACAASRVARREAAPFVAHASNAFVPALDKQFPGRQDILRVMVAAPVNTHSSESNKW